MRKYLEYSELDDYKIQLIEAQKEISVLNNTIKNLTLSLVSSNTKFITDLVCQGVKITLEGKNKNIEKTPLYFKNKV